MARPNPRGEVPGGPLGQDWLKELHSKGDLNASFDALDGRHHFYAETMHGVIIRSTQLRFEGVLPVSMHE